jgi:hypothetical protein
VAFQFIGCFVTSLSQSSAAHSRHPRSSANHQRRAFAPFQDPVHVHSLIIFHYTPIAQSVTLRASRAACERVDARVVRMNGKLERLWNSKRSKSISTFRFLSNHDLLRCHGAHLAYIFPTDCLHQTGHRPSSRSLMGRHALEAEPSRLA